MSLEEESRSCQESLQNPYSRYGKAANVLPEADLQTLMSHDWPGNVRELRNSAERFVLLGNLGHLNPESPSQISTPLAVQVAEFEKTIIEQALSSCNGRINEALDILQIARKTLYDKMQKYGLDKSDYKGD